MQNIIGIIGGMGPLASQLFYKMIIEHTAAKKDQDHINLILLNDTSMPDRTAAILNHDYDVPYQKLLADARLLENSGCIGIAITCNTSHFFADMIADKINIPIIHMIRETAEYISAACPKNSTIGIMATDGTIKTKLYQNALADKGLNVFTPPKDIQKEVMYQIYDRIKNGQKYDADSWKKIEQTYKNAGCHRVILACTELSVIKSDNHLIDWYVDPMEILTRKVIEFAGKEYK